MTSEKEKSKNTLLTADENEKKITDSTVKSYSCIEITGRFFQIVTNMERSVSYPSIKDIPDKKEMFINTRPLC